MITKLLAGLVSVATVLGLVASASGIVIPPGEQGATGPAQLLGQWGDNASCVVVGRDLVLTTIHQGGDVGTAVTVNGQSYTVSSIWTEPGGADLRLAKLTDAHFGDYAAIYTATDEVGQTALIGGFGDGIGGFVGDCGFTWSGQEGTLRWGNNRVDSLTSTLAGGKGTQELLSHFDTPVYHNYVLHESAVAAGDSGGGWLVQQAGQWAVMGLTASATHTGMSLYDDPATGGKDRDLIYAVRVSNYSSWIQDVVNQEGLGIPEPATLSLLAPLAVLLRRRR